MHYLTKEEIRTTITMTDIIQSVKQAFSMVEQGKINAPLRTVIPTEKGTLLFMPAYSPETELILWGALSHQFRVGEPPLR